MNISGNRLFVFTLLYMLGLASCAINNMLVIENEEDYSNVFTVKDRQLIFPAVSEVQFAPMYGASWDLSGNLATIMGRVVADFNSNPSTVIPAGQNSRIQVYNIVIKYTDSITDGSHTHLSLSLDMAMKLTRNGVLLASCRIPTVHPKKGDSVYHGLFAGRDRMRNMVLPAYEKLISKALAEALVTGFECLSEDIKLPK